MTEPAIVYDAVDGAARAAALRLVDLGEALQALKAHGLDRYDPARFHYLQVLAARVPAQPVAVQRGERHGDQPVGAQRPDPSGLIGSRCGDLEQRR